MPVVTEAKTLLEAVETAKNKLETEEQQIIWDKTKSKKKLTYSDFLIDRY